MKSFVPYNVGVPTRRLEQGLDVDVRRTILRP